MVQDSGGFFFFFWWLDRPHFFVLLPILSLMHTYFILCISCILITAYCCWIDKKGWRSNGWFNICRCNCCIRNNWITINCNDHYYDQHIKQKNRHNALSFFLFRFFWFQQSFFLLLKTMKINQNSCFVTLQKRNTKSFSFFSRFKFNFHRERCVSCKSSIETVWWITPQRTENIQRYEQKSKQTFMLGSSFVFLFFFFLLFSGTMTDDEAEESDQLFVLNGFGKFGISVVYNSTLRTQSQSQSRSQQWKWMKPIQTYSCNMRYKPNQSNGIFVVHHV